MSLGIYIQIPFCQTKCTYCNFHTGVVSLDRFQPYVNALLREIGQKSDFHNFLVDTVYFGGGTPSLLDPSALAWILNALRRHFTFVSSDDVSAHCPERSEGSALSSPFSSSEITLEADPETITPANSRAWLSAGFNRIYLGAQSFADTELQAAGRLHRRADIFRAVETLRAAGFANISLDLIAGLPHQSRVSWDRSIDELLRVRPEHISIYMLEIDEGSRLGRESLAGGARYSAQAIPPGDDIADFYESACLRLAASGYDHYEISNWALPGFRSRHNLKYWRREPYLGLGAGAHSFDGRSRWANVHDSARYVSLVESGNSPREQIEAVTPAQALEEELFLGLRQLEGIDLARIERDYGVALAPRIAPLRSQGLVEFDGTRLRLAPSRLAVSNEVFVALLG